jgi:hypothetical protein
MAKKSKSALTRKKTLTDVIKFAGTVSADGLYITIDDMETPTADLFKKFAGEYIEGGFGSKEEQDVEE